MCSSIPAKASSSIFEKMERILVGFIAFVVTSKDFDTVKFRNILMKYFSCKLIHWIPVVYIYLLVLLLDIKYFIKLQVYICYNNEEVVQHYLLYMF